MNYYIQGNKDNADQIRAAFERLGFDVTGFDMRNDNILFFTYKLQAGANVISTTNANLYTADIIKTHPDYKELELPKPHYNISNFYAGMPVLVRDNNEEEWRHTAFSHMTSRFYENKFAAGCTYWCQCIPFNDDTKHLLGTTDMCPEEYINW